MTLSPRTGMAQTVNGLVEPAALGVVMPHEHVFIDVTCMFDPPTEATDRARAYAPITLENLGWIRLHYFRHHDNLLLTDEQTAIDELALYRHAGGDTIVDVSTPGIGRDPVALRRVSRAAGTHIVMSTGYYVAPTHPERVARLAESAIAEWMTSEIVEGVRVNTAPETSQDWQPRVVQTAIRAGIIKVAASYPLHPDERKVINAAVAAQRATGAAITIHVGRHDRSALEILEALQAQGADLSRVSLDHLDLRVERMETLHEIAASGCFLEFDLFGTESSYYPLTDRDMPSDAQRMDVVGQLLVDGYGSQLLISQDICTRHRLTRYGGHGYGYIVSHIVLRLRDRGWPESAINDLVVSNPQRLLTFVEPAA